MRFTGQLISLILTLLLSVPAWGADPVYKKYESKKKDRPLLVLAVDQETWTVVLYEGDEVQFRAEYEADLVERKDRSIVIGEAIRLDNSGFEISGRFIPVEDIGDLQVDATDGRGATIITFMSVNPTRKKQSFRKNRDLISYWEAIVVDEDKFVRGSVVALSGEVDINGEVNGDVVAVFGDIRIGGDAVIRGDVIAVNGSIKLDPESSVYGLVSSSKGDYSSRRNRARRWRKFETNTDWKGICSYDRVDGLALGGGVAYNDGDSILPSFEAGGAYAFASERWRYNLGLTQTIIRGPVPVQIGGEVFRALKSDDDRIIGDGENMIFALLFNEDWKDFYEAEGAYGFVRISFLKWNKVEIGYLSETQTWLKANTKLWSLFGKKDFRGNFSSVDYDLLQARSSDFDDARVTSLTLKLSIDSRDDEKHPQKGWYGYAAYESSPGDWTGDFDFERTEFKLKRYQSLSRYLSVNFLAAYGRLSGSHIPLNRTFFLGGLGTLHGYRHKEFMGNEYIMISGEYRFRIPHSEISPLVQYDGGKIAPDRLASGQDWYGALSVGVDVGQNLKIMISKRLDQDDEDTRFYARFSANPF